MLTGVYTLCSLYVRLWDLPVTMDTVTKDLHVILFM